MMSLPGDGMLVRVLFLFRFRIYSYIFIGADVVLCGAADRVCVAIMKTIGLFFFV